MIRYKGKCPSEYINPYGSSFKVKYERGMIDTQTYTYLCGLGHMHKFKPLAKGVLLEDLTNNWRPMVPVEIHAQLLLLGFVKDVPSFVDELRPMLYVYWR